MKPFIVCVTGGRTFSDHWAVNKVLSHIRDNLPKDLNLYVLEGGALGADRACRNWAINNFVPVLTCEAQWTNNERAAGMIRNGWMSELPVDLLVAFPGGNGTAGMVDICTNKGIPIFHVSSTIQYDNSLSSLTNWLSDRSIA